MHSFKYKQEIKCGQFSNFFNAINYEYWGVFAIGEMGHFTLAEK